MVPPSIFWPRNLFWGGLYPEEYGNYINEAKKEGFFGGNIEISTRSFLFCFNIRIYLHDYGKYKLYIIDLIIK